MRAFEAFKKDGGNNAVPDVPFEMLTALELTKEHWSSIAKTMTWTQTRMNLNTLLRKGVATARGGSHFRRDHRGPGLRS